MKRVVLSNLFALLISYTCYGYIVPWSTNYTGQVDSYFKRDGTLYSLRETTTNGTVAAFSTHYPYTGGAAINIPDEMTTPARRIAALILSDNIFRNPIPDCWISGYIDGSIRIEETPQYPIGTPITLKLDYFTQDYQNPSRFYLDRGAAIVNDSGDILWMGIHYTNEMIETYEIPVNTGSTYYFYMWQNFGSASNPVNVNAVGAAVSIGFNTIPEPATMLLLGLGAMLLRWKK